MNHAFRSTWGALLWKEWRQQRLAFAALAFLSLGAPAVFAQLLGGGIELDATVILLVPVALCFAANAFASARDDGTEGFLSAIPMSRWQHLLIRYVSAVFLALLCVVPALFLVLSLVPIAPNAQFGLGFIPLVGTPPSLLIWGLLVTTMVVAVAGAVAGSGLGAISTLLVVVALYIIGAGVAGTVAGIASSILGGPACQRGVYRGLLSIWVVAHLWLLRAWLGRRDRVPADRWRVGAWVLLLFCAPQLASLVLAAYERHLPGPRQYARRDAAWGSVHACPSPDGRTIALTTLRGPAFDDSFGLAAWLMDADTGRISRTTSRWTDSQFLPAKTGWSCWSPDGSQVALHVTPRSYPGGRTPEMAAAEAEQWVVRVGDGREAAADRFPTPSVRRSRETIEGRSPTPELRQRGWLGDGTPVAWTPKGWAFRDPNSGTIQLCAFPEEESLDIRSFEMRASIFWLDRALITMRGHVCWRYAPGLPSAERIDVLLPRHQEWDKAYWKQAQQWPVGERRTSSTWGQCPVDISRDGRWLLMAQATPFVVPLCLIWLKDGTGQVLMPSDSGRYHGAAFTRDASRLLVVGSRALHVWNLENKRWEPPQPLPKPVRRLLATWRAASVTSYYAFSPSRPWRVAFLAEGRRVFVLDVEQRQEVEVRLPQIEGTARSGGWAARKGAAEWGKRPPNMIRWFGNDRLLVDEVVPYHLWVVEADGSGSRQVLP